MPKRLICSLKLVDYLCLPTKYDQIKVKTLLTSRLRKAPCNWSVYRAPTEVLSIKLSIYIDRRGLYIYTKDAIELLWWWRDFNPPPLSFDTYSITHYLRFVKCFTVNICIRTYLLKGYYMCLLCII